MIEYTANELRKIAKFFIYKEDEIFHPEVELVLQNMGDYKTTLPMFCKMVREEMERREQLFYENDLNERNNTNTTSEERINSNEIFSNYNSSIDDIDNWINTLENYTITTEEQ
jgi:hypothetical protein